MSTDSTPLKGDISSEMASQDPHVHAHNSTEIFPSNPTNTLPSHGLQSTSPGSDVAPPPSSSQSATLPNLEGVATVEALAQILAVLSKISDTMCAQQNQAPLPHRGAEAISRPLKPMPSTSDPTDNEEHAPKEAAPTESGTSPTRHRATAASGNPPPPPPTTFFGITQPQSDNFRPGYEDYEQTFPEDEYGHETGPNARVFKVFNEEAATHDADMVAQCRDSSDVILVFAGLFSAVLTTFVAQTSQALEPNNAEISNSLLAELVEVQRAQANGTFQASTIERAITDTKPSTIDVWVNGLWFTSLTLSLATALFAVLTKQWLRHYTSKTSGEIRDRCFIRLLRSTGMDKWRVIAVIDVLLTLLHLSLGIFLVGLIVFLTPRSPPLALVVSGITLVIYFFYFLTNFLPIVDITCPYQTPVTNVLNILFSYLLVAGQELVKLLGLLPYTPSFAHKVYTFKSLSTQERNHVQMQSGRLSLDAITWLLDTSSNPSVHAVAVEAIGGLSPSQREGASRKLNILRQNFMYDQIEKCLILSGRDNPTCRPGCAGKLERLSRVFPLCGKQDNNIPWNICAIFKHDSDNIPGMAAALGVGSNEGNHSTTILKHLLHSPKVTLSPSAWITLFKNVRNVGPMYRFEICKRALEDWNPNPAPLSWNAQIVPVPMSDLLTRESPELLLLAFGDCYCISLQPPDSPQLHALLTIHQFLESSASDSSKSLLLSLWKHIRRELDWNSTAHDCTLVFHTTTKCLLQWQQHEWTLSEDMSKYCYALLGTCNDALMYASSALQGIQWNWAELVAEIAFSTNGLSEDYNISTCKMAGRLWGLALDMDIEGAYTSFIKFQVLGHQPSAFNHFPWLVQIFISGLVYQLARPSPHPDWFMKCKSYLHVPDNLLMTCKILVEHEYSYSMYDKLAQIDPDNEAWEGCREKLRQWRPDNNDWLASFNNSLDKLEKFFKARRRRKEHFNPVFYFCSVFGRHGNTSAASPPADVEKGSLSTSQAANNELATTVSGDSVIELDGEIGDSVWLPNEEDIERSSSRGSETGISPAQEESSLP